MDVLIDSQDIQENKSSPLYLIDAETNQNPVPQAQWSAALGKGCSLEVTV